MTQYFKNINVLGDVFLRSGNIHAVVFSYFLLWSQLKMRRPLIPGWSSLSACLCKFSVARVIDYFSWVLRGPPPCQTGVISLAKAFYRPDERRNQNYHHCCSCCLLTSIAHCLVFKDPGCRYISKLSESRTQIYTQRNFAEI